MIQRKKHHLDMVLLNLVIFFIILEILLIATISFPLALEKFDDGYFFLRHQLIYGLIPGIFLGLFFLKIPLNSLKKKSLILFLLNLIILACVFLPKIGVSFEGASRWIKLGGITFQPSEFLKITAILYLASLISKKENKKKNSNILFFSFLVILAAIALPLKFQPHISTLGIISITLLLVYFAGKTPLFHTVFIILLLLGGLVFLMQSASYRLERLLVYLEPEIDPLGIGYQSKQSLITIGSGRILGQGIGYSRQKFGFLPQPISDCIFAIFAEETGFLGAATLILLFLIFLWRGVKISKESSDLFSRLVGLGIIFWLTFQAFLNISGLLGIIPLSGIPLPFIGYGGSHLIVELIGVGILLNISKNRSL